MVPKQSWIRLSHSVTLSLIFPAFPPCSPVFERRGGEEEEWRRRGGEEEKRRRGEEEEEERRRAPDRQRGRAAAARQLVWTTSGSAAPNIPRLDLPMWAYWTLYIAQHRR